MSSGRRSSSSHPRSHSRSRSRPRSLVDTSARIFGIKLKNLAYNSVLEFSDDDLRVFLEFVEGDRDWLKLISKSFPNGKRVTSRALLKNNWDAQALIDDLEVDSKLLAAAGKELDKNLKDIVAAKVTDQVCLVYNEIQSKNEKKNARSKAKKAIKSYDSSSSSSSSSSSDTDVLDSDVDNRDKRRRSLSASLNSARNKKGKESRRNSDSSDLRFPDSAEMESLLPKERSEVAKHNIERADKEISSLEKQMKSIKLKKDNMQSYVIDDVKGKGTGKGAGKGKGKGKGKKNGEDSDFESD